MGIVKKTIEQRAFEELGGGKSQNAMTLFDIERFNKEIDKQVKELKLKGVKPSMIAVKNWGYYILTRHLVNIKADGAKYVEDSGNLVIFEYKGMQVVNVAKPRENGIMHEAYTNYVEVYGK